MTKISEPALWLISAKTEGRPKFCFDGKKSAD